MPFDYDNAERDLYDAGDDPDYLDHRHPEKRDKYLRDRGMNPQKYGGGSSSSPSRRSSRRGGSSSSSRGGCFLTSACMEAKGLPDDCDELETMRRYRDEVLARQTGGKEEINRYYAIAPDIVENINKRKDAKEIWQRVYDEMVAPCVAYIKAAEYDQAFALYRDYALRLEAQY